MKINGFLRNLIILSIIFCNIGCDQVSKNIIRNKLDYYQEVSLLKNYLTLTKVENSGAFLSLGESLPYPIKFVLLALLPTLALGLGTYVVLSKSNLSKSMIVGICCVIGGGVGNLYDRLVHGSVTDFLHADFVIFRTGIFNLADVSIMFGMGIILLNVYSFKGKLSTAG